MKETLQKENHQDSYWHFAIPIFMANILQLTYSIVDTRIVGSYLGETSLAAVGATTTLQQSDDRLLMGLANGFCHNNSPEIWSKGTTPV